MDETTQYQVIQKKRWNTPALIEAETEDTSKPDFFKDVIVLNSSHIGPAS